MVSYFWVQDYRNDTGMYKFWRKNSCDLIVSERFIILNSAANPWTFGSLCCGSQQLDLRYLYLLCSGMTTTFMCTHYTTTRKAHGVLFPRWWAPNQASLISALHRTGHCILWLWWARSLPFCFCYSRGRPGTLPGSVQQTTPPRGGWRHFVLHQVLDANHETHNVYNY